MRLQQTGDDVGALRVLEEMRRESHDQSEKIAILVGEATSLTGMGRFAEAESRLDEAESMAEDPWVFAMLWLQRTNVLWFAVRWEEALKLIERTVGTYRAVLESPEHRDLYELSRLRLGTLLVEFGRYQEASPILDEALSFELTDNEKALLYFETGTCHYHLGNIESSKHWFLQALSIGCGSYKSVLARYFLGAINFRERKYAEALTEFQWCEVRLEEGRIAPRQLYAWLAKTFRILGDQDQARRYATLKKVQ